MEDAVILLKELLRIPSVNGRDDEGSVAEYLCRYFTAAGIPAEVHRIDEKHANVTAVLEGEDWEKPIVWNGHLDTVPYGKIEEWQTDPACPVEKDGFLYARGASDMKSGLAAMVYALCSAKKSGRKPARTIRFLGTCDEEKGGLGASHALTSGFIAGAGEMLIGEPTGCLMGIAQKGCLWLEIQAGGRTSHGAYPEEGRNAVDYAVSLAGRIKAYAEQFRHPVLGHSTAQITQISGGVAPNMTPDACTILMDIRMVPGLTTEDVLKQAGKEAEQCSGDNGGGFKSSFTVKNNRRAIEIQPDHALVRKLAGCIENQGLNAGTMGINYFTDASILAGDMPDMAVLLFGPGEPGMAHKPNERVELQKYRNAIAVLTDMMF